jgi:uncharacterized protein YdeI (YjbR/CyaY-like superfamily)
MERFDDVDAYVQASTQWRDEIELIRPVLLRTGLTEQIKWGKPCYSHDGSNVVILQEMKEFLALMFFDGALLADPEGILESQGPNSRSARRICFRSPADVRRLSKSVRSYIAEAIALADAGVTVEAAPELVLVDELAQRLASDAALARGFAKLTPGRQREYHLHIADAKKSETRHARIDKYADKIRSGKGLRDR